MGGTLTKSMCAGRVAVITGGGSGIGAAAAHKCGLELGMKVVLADIDTEGMAEVEAQLRRAGVTVTSIRTDVGSLKSVEALRDAVYNTPEFGECGFLFNNAGLAVGRSSYLSAMAEWKLCLDVNLWGVIHGLHAFVPKMLEQTNGGRVVSTSSLAGLMNSSPETGVPYVVAKHSVTLIMEALQHELRSHKGEQQVVAHLLHPGVVRTNIESNSKKSMVREGVERGSDSGLRAVSKTETQNLLDAQKRKELTYSSEGLVDGLWKRMVAGDFYCIVSPRLQPEDLYKGLAALRAEDIMMDRPPLAQHVPEYRAETRRSLKAFRERASSRARL
eukprot:gnl/TRDRNA2_/TRDRNA2_207897_c0_seq1.p1 gnl/TRDRNA2_/TRDRNA2_207897_c0~~gnl/TRDRNA2_/TRDRNA2_207897_c0_seq1.p1  ORF type:complete len:330 (+),score=67.22 gnl/TRDRNA2_/TRDRNA2_207897_c0_seq1:100-1089(+)